jgi:DNA-binding transcriptional ArsR family regulator
VRRTAHPAVEDLDLATVLHAMADPVRLAALRQIGADPAGRICAEIHLPVGQSTKSHHLKVLREAGLLRVFPEGRFRRHELRSEELQRRFPGVLDAVLACSDGRG